MAAQKKKVVRKKVVKKKSPKKVTVARGVKVTRAQEKKMEKKRGSSNVGEYKKVAPKDFAGAAGGAAKYSFPINTLKRARAALAYAHNAPNPAGIRKKVYEMYPQLKVKKKVKRKKMRKKDA